MTACWQAGNNTNEVVVRFEGFAFTVMTMGFTASIRSAETSSLEVCDGLEANAQFDAAEM